jgi:hypothetical protein
MKPVALVERAIRNSSKDRDTVLEQFSGDRRMRLAAALPTLHPFRSGRAQTLTVGMLTEPGMMGPGSPSWDRRHRPCTGPA